MAPSSRRRLYTGLALLALLLAATTVMHATRVQAQEGEEEAPHALAAESQPTLEAAQTILSAEEGKATAALDTAAEPHPESERVSEEVPVVEAVATPVEEVVEEVAVDVAMDVAVDVDVDVEVQVATAVHGAHAEVPESVAETTLTQAAEAERVEPTPEPAAPSAAVPEPTPEVVAPVPEPTPEVVAPVPEPTPEAVAAPAEPESPPEPPKQREPPAEKTGQAEQGTCKMAKNRSTVRSRAKVLPEGCLRTVERYLQHIHEDRTKYESAVADARASLNEAHVHKPNEVAKWEAALEKAAAALRTFDREAIQAFGGDLPKTCIAEVDAIMAAKPPIESESNFIQTYAHFWRLLSGHARVFGLLFQAEYSFRRAGFEPLVVHFKGFAQRFYSKARTLFNEAHPKPGLLGKLTGKQKLVPMKDFIAKTLQGAAYACVPLVVAAVGGIVVFCFLPVTIAAIVVPDILYALYVKLFFFYYTYGIVFPDDALAAAQEVIATAKAGNWASVAEMGLDALLELAGEPEGFYNGILLAATAWTIGLSVFIMLLAYAMFVCGPSSSRRPAPVRPAPRPAPSARNRK